MKRKEAINVAIISSGNEVSHLVSALGECQSVNVIGLYDSSHEPPSALIAQEFGIALLDSIEQLPSVDDVDIIMDVSDDMVALKGLERVEHVEVVRGRGLDIIGELAEKHVGRSREIDNISKIGSELASQKESQDIYRTIVQGAIDITGAKTGSLILFDEKNDLCRLAEVNGYSKEFDENYSWGLQPGGISEQLVDGEGPMFIPNINEEPLFDNPVMNEETVSVLATTLREADEVIGLLFVGDLKPRLFSTREISLLNAFAGQASLALQKALLIERNEALTVTDNLTGLNNSRHFFEALDAEIRRARRYGGRFSILKMDLDNLSYVNDYFGLAKGDWAIKKVAEIINTCSRQTDYKARYGGDEFAMILPSTSCQHASVLANRIRRQINDVVVKGDEEEVRLSISIGIAEFPCLGTDCDSLVSAVNTALTVCKQRGRNLVCCYGDTSEEISGVF